MMQPTYIAVNQTTSSISLHQLALTVPATGSVRLSDYNKPFEIVADTQLRSLIESGSILINDGTTTLTTLQSIQYTTQVASINDLKDVEAGAQVVNWGRVSQALGGQAGSNTNFVFRSDGAGSGSMTKNVSSIPRKFIVGTGRRRRLHINRDSFISSNSARRVK